MYHEEKIIGGVLYWRGTPHGHWKRYTLQQLTRKLVEAERKRCKMIDAFQQIEQFCLAASGEEHMVGMGLPKKGG